VGGGGGKRPTSLPLRKRTTKRIAVEGALALSSRRLERRGVAALERVLHRLKLGGGKSQLLPPTNHNRKAAKKESASPVGRRRGCFGSPSKLGDAALPFDGAAPPCLVFVPVPTKLTRKRLGMPFTHETTSQHSQKPFPGDTVAP